MSREGPTGLSVLEKLIGFIIIIMGIALTYITCTNPPTGEAAAYTSIFISVGIALIGIGVFIILAKTE